MQLSCVSQTPSPSVSLSAILLTIGNMPRNGYTARKEIGPPGGPATRAPRIVPSLPGFVKAGEPGRIASPSVRGPTAPSDPVVTGFVSVSQAPHDVNVL